MSTLIFKKLVQSSPKSSWARCKYFSTKGGGPLVQLVKSTDDTGIATLKLNSPPVNALSAALFRDATAALDECEADPDTRAVILTSALPSVFCGGLDFSELYQRTDAELRSFWHTLLESSARLFSFSLPLAAAVCGHAPAGGVLLYSCADYRYGLQSSI